MMKNFTLISVFFLAASLIAGDHKGKGHKGDGPCKEDAKKLCEGVKEGKGAIRKCLKEKEDQLSDACKTHLAKHKNHKNHK